MRAEVIRTASDPDVIQQALHDMEIPLNQEGNGHDIKCYINDLLELSWSIVENSSAILRSRAALAAYPASNRLPTCPICANLRA